MDLMNLKPTSDIVEVTLKHPNTGAILTNDDKTDMCHFVNFLQDIPLVGLSF